MFEARAVSVRLGTEDVLRSVDIAVGAGEVVAVCGPNGAGKSTLLATLAGDIRPWDGAVCLDGRPVQDMPAMELAARRAVLEQHPTLSAPFTIRELLSLSVPPQIPQDRLDALILRHLEAVGLLGQIGRNCLTLSGGQRHRAHLARVLVQLDASDARQTYLLLDEPTASLDLAHQIATLRIVRQTARDGSGILVVLHDLNLAAAYADRVVLMRDGRIVEVGAPDDVLTAARLSDLYGTAIRVERGEGDALRILPVYR